MILLLALGADSHLPYSFHLLRRVAILALRGGFGFDLAVGAPAVLQVLALKRDVFLIMFHFDYVLHLELLEVLINVLHLVEAVVININDLIRDVINLVNPGGV